MSDVGFGALLADDGPLAEAISFGLQKLTLARPDDPVHFLAQQLRAFSERNKCVLPQVC